MMCRSSRDSRSREPSRRCFTTHCMSQKTPKHWQPQVARRFGHETSELPRISREGKVMVPVHLQYGGLADDTVPSANTV